MTARLPIHCPVAGMTFCLLWLAMGVPAFAQEPVARAVRLPAATVVEASMRDMTETVPINGSLVARETVSVTPQVTGYQILDVLADIGDSVAKGDVLLRLDRAPLETQLKQAEAEIASAEAAIAQTRSQIAGQDATLTQATTVLERARRLLGRGAGTQSVLDDAEAQFAGAVASLQGARDALASADAQRDLSRARRDDIALQLSRTDVRAPVSGVVASRSANIGQTAGADGTAMMTLIRDGEIEFDGLIIETALAQARVGQTAVLRLSGYPERIGKVRLISPSVDPATRLGSIKIAIDAESSPVTGAKAPATLPIGIFGSAVLTVAERKTVAVPLAAVVPSPDGSTVQVVDRESIIEVRPVETGIVEGLFVEIADGLDAGETVVAKSGPFFRDGMKIRSVPATALPAVAGIPSVEEAELARGAGRAQAAPAVTR